MFKKAIVITLALLTLCLSACGSVDTISNSYVPEVFEFDGNEYNIHDASLISKFEEDEWLFEADGKILQVYKEYEVPIPYSKKTETKRNVFFITTKKDVSKYKSYSECKIESILFDSDQMTSKIEVSGFGFGKNHEDAELNFGTKFTGTETSATSAQMNYSASNRSMILYFENDKLNKIEFILN